MECYCSVAITFNDASCHRHPEVSNLLFRAAPLLEHGFLGDNEARHVRRS